MSLFDPIIINRTEIPNRIVKSAMAEGACDSRGQPTPALRRMYETWSRGGVGLAITGMAHVRAQHSFTNHEIGLHEDRVVAPLRDVTAAVHRHGGKIFAQLCHAPPQLPRQKAHALRPPTTSAGFNRTTLRFDRSLSDEQIRGLTGDFARAAARAKAAGFDGVQLHSAHGYLLSRFLSPLFNRRRDAWGGSFDRRLAFLECTYRAIRETVGADYPVIIKLNAHDGRPGGLDLDTSVRIAQRLEQWGFDAIEVSAGTGEVGLGFYPTRGEIPLDLGEQFLYREFPFLRMARPLVRVLLRRLARQVAFAQEAYFLPEAERIASAVSIPVICVGGIRSLASAQQIIENTRVKMVALARPLVRQPALARAWRTGHGHVADCSSCNRCFVQIGLGKPLRCWSR